MRKNKKSLIILGCRHVTGAGSSHQQVVGCGLDEDNEGRSDLWQISNDAATEVFVNCIHTLKYIYPLFLQDTFDPSFPVVFEQNTSLYLTRL